MTPTAELPPPLLRLLHALGDFRAGGRADGVFEWQWIGPGSVPELQGLGNPELGLDLMPSSHTPQQRAILGEHGYSEEARGELLTFLHPEWPTVVLLDHDAGQSMNQRLLREHLSVDAPARQRYREVFAQDGRKAADAALLPDAEAAHVARMGFAPLERAAALLAPLDLPWMFAAGWALDLFLQGRTAADSLRPHEDTDLILPRDAQFAVRDILRAAGYNVHAVQDGVYISWEAPLEPPNHQAHAFALETGEMLDLMLTDLSGGLWHYRRAPSITLPLERARRISAGGLPYLAPEAALLFKSATRGGQPRLKDQRDFERIRPHLDEAAREWLAQHLSAGHGWLAALEGRDGK